MGDYVFSSMGKDGNAGRICEPRKAMLRANKAAGSEVTVHGLRRTFATVLESLDCPAYPLKALLGHSMKGDVTASHYTQIGVERLRPWLEKYERFMLKLIDGRPEAKEVDTTEN
ncbi:Phage integrase family protein [Nitrosovibrio tenuis]|uniref:Phage integrase family protein n=2 Tax=Nitrosovibrio tenuis TaxID=1233 RepID=A0A1H7PAJ0_9PROT|nr:Phage integrase family protein [Nitrosovibrio tenuis]